MNARKAISITVITVVAALAGGRGARAHTELLFPPPRYDRTHQKSGPCGHPQNPAGEVASTFAPGSAITVRWSEFVGHPGHFRIAVTDEGDGAFVDPRGYDDFYVSDNVIADAIPDPDDRSVHELEISLPDYECEHCVLQLIQVMTDKPPWGSGGGKDLYYQCADIALVEGSESTPDAGDGPDGGATGCRVGSDGPDASLALLVGLALVHCPRRRSR